MDFLFLRKETLTVGSSPQMEELRLPCLLSEEAQERYSETLESGLLETVFIRDPQRNSQWCKPIHIGTI